jgi:polyisoprenoid-binding protein YceI
MFPNSYSARHAVALIISMLTLTLTLMTPARANVETFNIDSAHSFANWELRHIVARVSGTFHDIKGTVIVDTSNLANSSVTANISIYSLNSSHLRRDVHTLTDEFLDARNHPEMKFESTSIVPVTPENGSMTGQLTLRGVTRPVTMAYHILGFGPDPWGGMRAGFKATTRINRSDFGITKFTPSGPVGNEVDITLLIEGIKLGPDGKPWNAKTAAEEKSKVISYPMPILAEPPIVAIPFTSAVAAPVATPVLLPSTTPAAPPLLAPPSVQTAPVASPKPAPQAGVQPAPPAVVTPAKKADPSVEDQLKQKLKGLLK